jgi:hypothetical protein
VSPSIYIRLPFYQHILSKTTPFPFENNSYQKLSICLAKSDSDDHSNNGECPECGGRGNKPKKPKKALRDLCEEQTLREFSKVVIEESFASRYFCGGILANLPTAGSTTLRWDDRSEKGRTRKCNFPIDSKLMEGEVISMVTLLRNSCDENGALKAKDFSINFDPHGSGILDIISQLLIPGF